MNKKVEDEVQKAVDIAETVTGNRWKVLQNMFTVKKPEE